MSSSPRNLLAPILAAVTLAHCGQNDASDSKNIFGPDNREDIRAATAPYGSIGRLDSGCTGTLIGKRLMLTAAHCVVDQATGAIKSDFKYFRPNLIDGHSDAPTWMEFAWFGSERPEDERGKDWAVVKLKDPIGTLYGTVAVHKVDFAAALPYTTSLAGYSVDRDNGDTASVHRGCYIHAISGERLLHDCDATAGVSGGPMINTISGNPHIVAISVSEYRRGAAGSVTRDSYSADYANVAISSAAFIDTVNRLRESVDNGIAAPALPGIIGKPNPNQEPSDPGDPGNPGDPGDPNDALVDDRALQRALNEVGQIMDSVAIETDYVLREARRYNDARVINHASLAYRHNGDLEAALDDYEDARAPYTTERIRIEEKLKALRREILALDNYAGLCRNANGLCRTVTPTIGSLMSYQTRLEVLLFR